MTKKPPHLPNKACRVDTYYRLQNVKWLLLFVLFAFISGASASAIIASWVLPAYNQVQIIQTIFDNHTSLDSLPDTLLKKQVGQRMISIYDARSKIAENIYPENSLVSNAIIISSDGWAVFPWQNYVSLQEKNWEILDDKYVIYKIEKSIFDATNHLLYIKVKANGWRVMSFFDWQKIGINYNLWSVDGDGWQKKSVNKLIVPNGEVLDLLKSWPSLQLNEPAVVGSFLFSPQGELIGIVTGTDLTIPSRLIEYQISSLLESDKLKKIGSIWQGYFVKVFNEVEMDRSAFYIKVAPTTMGTSTLGLGDMIFSIDGKNVDKANLTSQMWLSSDEVNFSVWRDGQEVSVVMPKSTFLP